MLITATATARRSSKHAFCRAMPIPSAVSVIVQTYPRGGVAPSRANPPEAPLPGEDDHPMQGREGPLPGATIGGMPLSFRHLAAAFLPLAATVAGILAVTIAVQLPTGPSSAVPVPAVVLPASPAPSVVAHLPSGRARSPAPVISSVAEHFPGAGHGSASPVTAPLAVATTAPRAASKPQAKPTLSLPRPSRKPRPSDEAAAPPPPIAPVAPATPAPVAVAEPAVSTPARSTSSSSARVALAEAPKQHQGSARGEEKHSTGSAKEAKKTEEAGRKGPGKDANKNAATGQGAVTLWANETQEPPVAAASGSSSAKDGGMDSTKGPGKVGAPSPPMGGDQGRPGESGKGGRRDVSKGWNGSQGGHGDGGQGGQGNQGGQGGQAGQSGPGDQGGHRHDRGGGGKPG